LAIPLMALLAVVQAAILARFPVLGLVPQLPFLVAVAWTLLKGREEGVVWAFIAGFFLDLFSSAPLGTSSLAFMLAIMVISLLQQSLPISRFFLPAVLAGLATLVSLLLYLLLLRLTGYPVDWQRAAALPPVAVLHAALVLPVYWLLHTLERLLRRRPVEI
jgi:rod shape-determining protein MreD